VAHSLCAFPGHIDFARALSASGSGWTKTRKAAGPGPDNKSVAINSALKKFSTVSGCCYFCLSFCTIIFPAGYVGLLW